MLTTLTLVLALLPPVACAATGEEEGDRLERAEVYQQVLYPEGLPRTENPFTGDVERPRFQLEDEVRLEEVGLTVVVFAEHLPIEGSDDLFEVALASLAGGDPPRKVVDRRVLTDRIPVYTEFPGHVDRLQACLNAFEISPGVPAVHLTLWALLSGTGSVSGASDLFFAVRESGELVPVLELIDSSSYSSLGVSGYRVKDTALHLADLDGDSSLEVIATEYVKEPQDDRVTVAPGSPAVFGFEGGSYRPLDAAESALPGGGVESLPGSRELERCSGVETIRPEPRSTSARPAGGGGRGT